MRYLFIIIILLLIPIWSFAGEIHGDFEVGHFIHYEAFFVRLLIGYYFPILIFKNQIYGGWKTEFQLPDQGITINRIIADVYTIGYKVQFKDIYLKLDHECRHRERAHEYAYTITTLSLGVEW